MRKIQMGLLTFFLMGFLIGIISVLMLGTEVLEGTTLMSRYFFSRYAYKEISVLALFMYVFKKRMCTIWLLWLLGLTALGTFFVSSYLLWFGFSVGFILTTAVWKMGAYGIGCCVVSSLPHMLVYIPLCCWYFRKIKEMAKEKQKKDMKTYLCVWFVVSVGMLLGIFLESVVNPVFLRIFLKNI